MGAAIFSRYRQSLLDSTAPALNSGTTSAVLLNLVDTPVSGGQGVPITSTNTGTPMTVTFTDPTPFLFAAGDRVAIQDAVDPVANGTWRIGFASATTITLENDTDGLSHGGGAGASSGGSIFDLSQIEFANDLNNVIGPVINLTGRSINQGVFDAADVVFPSVAAAAVTINAVVIYDDTGSAATSQLIAIIGSDVATGLPVVPNGGDIDVAWSSNGIFTAGATAP